MCPRRFPLFALSLFLALLLFPSRALALDFIPKGLVYSADLDGSRFGAVAVAANQFDAACYALGKEPASISTSIRSKLSDPNYGGRFYEFSQAFYTQGWPLEDVPEWLPAYVWGSVELSDLLLSDYQSVWYVTCTQSLRSGALSDFLAVLSGEDLSGGSSSSVSFPVVVDSDDIWFGANISVSGFSVSSATQFVFNIVPTSTVINFINSHIEQYPYFYVVVSAYGSEFIYNRRNFNNVIVDYFLSDHALSTSVNGNSHWIGSNTSVYHAQHKYDVAKNGVTTCSWSNTPSLHSAGQTRSSAMWVKRVTGVDPPAGTWPEPSSPAAPVEPTLPDPATPIVQPDPVVIEPTPTWPVIPTPTDPTVTLTDTPSGLDYTQLLTLINDNLNDINSYTVAINSNFNSLRSDLVTEFDSVVQALRNIYQYLQHFDDVLERHCVHLQNKLEDVSVDIQNKIREMVRWLADELDFDSVSSGNSSLFGILSTINDKLGGGTYEPNPLKSEDSYYEWLDDLWDRFLLGDNWQSSASSMSQSFGQLTSRFPFSVPWDIVALFRLFVHDPVTPVFDLPLYYSSEDSATVRVDLSAWDGVASVVRPLVFVIFALKLALLSRHLLAGFGADKGGL